jgi:hypothetical protein
MDALSGSKPNHGLELCNGVFTDMSSEQWRQLQCMTLPKIFYNLNEEQKSPIILGALHRITESKLPFPYSVKLPFPYGVIDMIKQSITTNNH